MAWAAEHATKHGGRAIALSLVLMGAGCRLPPPDEPEPSPRVTLPYAPRDPSPAFSGEAALDRVRALMLHPRTLGDAARERSIEALARMLADAGAQQVERQPFVAIEASTGRSYALVNLFGHLHPQAPRRVVLATHFDTRPWADQEPDPMLHEQPVPGANDGTSGVAVLLELLPLLAAALPPDVGVTVILFDGEELGRPGEGERGGYCAGSRHFAAEAARQPPAWLRGAEAGIVLDMVGDRDLHLPIEPGSAKHAPALVQRLWTVARRRGHAQFQDHERELAILDDHVLLTQAGVPSVLIIDHEYDAWHTRRDTIDRLSSESLFAVGDTVLHTVLELLTSPKP
ncbi:M28 family peptidase [Paraliomyxa miuraensis]|uniref:M28 family peptidase n=1 Tax=Paraliomyxa miuraensis TaxID=376150 RepID=UPI002250C320|nr:M28 family peptidase [Paraliomyxa miuraensis]MCX4240252.1 M28 family peptidase [Paraliomyxa miuraensis]